MGRGQLPLPWGNPFCQGSPCDPEWPGLGDVTSASCPSQPPPQGLPWNSFWKVTQDLAVPTLPCWVLSALGSRGWWESWAPLDEIGSPRACAAHCCSLGRAASSARSFRAKGPRQSAGQALGGPHELLTGRAGGGGVFRSQRWAVPGESVQGATSAPAQGQTQGRVVLGPRAAPPPRGPPGCGENLR